MNVILFGATGMVGQGVLRECLLDPGVERVLSVGRNAIERQHPKLRECLQADLFDLSPIETQLQGYDACFFCLGVSSVGMTEEAYTHMTYDLTLSVAQTLARFNPEMTFIYISGAGTDSSERGRSMWARAFPCPPTRRLATRAISIIEPTVPRPSTRQLQAARQKP